jgi:drug/metabolite transporter (DMT)-like permease
VIRDSEPTRRAFGSPSNQSMASAVRIQRLKADLILLVVAIIWGSAFVAQRAGNEQVGPFTFNAARFLVGSLVLLPTLIWRRPHGKQTSASSPASSQKNKPWRSGLLLGLILFGGASLQQLGLVTTTAGKGGFITGLYVVIVPLLLALFWRDRIRWANWAGAGLAVVGLFLLSIDLREAFSIDPGNVWVLLGAFLWAMHVIVVGRLAPGRDPLKLAAAQYVVCALLCAATALVLEWGTWDGIVRTTPAILYAGVFSTGLAYTGQVVAQRHAPAADAAIILSMESVFAALSGWLALGETLTAQQMAGCALMFAGMLMAQLPSFIPNDAGTNRRSETK